LISTWRGPLFGVDAAADVFPPGAHARIAPTTFDAWLAAKEFVRTPA